MQRNLSGGRSLNVIWQHRALTSSQKLILQYIASQLNFNGNFDESRWFAMTTIMDATNMSERKIRYDLRELEANGFLARTRRFEGNVELPSAYALTDKLFEETGNDPRHNMPHPPAQYAPPPGTICPTVGHHVPTELPHELPSEAPSVTPSFLPAAKAAKKSGTVSNLTKKRSEQEACEIISSVVSHDGFVNVKALNGTAKAFLEQFGIETLRAFRAQVMAEGRLGQISWEAGKFTRWLEEYHYSKGVL